MDNKPIPSLPVEAPQRSGRLIGKIACGLLRLVGWQLKGEFPPFKKALIALGPHTSNWDFIFAVLCLLALRARISFIMKKEAFIWPFAPLFMRIGGIPLDRSKGQGTVAKVAAWFDSVDKGWLAIAPEGTRSKTPRWKTGFLEIAKQANVPVILVCWDYPSKTIFIDKEWVQSGDPAADADAIKAYVNKRYTGKNPGQQ